MISRFSISNIVLSLVFLTGRPSTAQTGTFDLEKTKAALSGMIQGMMKDRGVPSMSIALVRGDKIVWTAAFGYANVAMKTPATPETYYNTGSTLKAVTATAVMQLADQGLLSIDDAINNYLGKSKVQERLQSEKRITFRHLLTHFSGLSQGVEKQPIWSRKTLMTLDEIAASLYSIRAPETKWEYNNFAYATAGLLAEKISGLEYEAYIAQKILKPLGSETTHPLTLTPKMVERLALPYNPGGSAGEPEPVAQVQYDYYPAGDLYTTAEDMARFLGAHLNKGVFNGNRILSEQAVAMMHTAQFGSTYGFGFDVEKDAKGHTIISHGGRSQGYHAYMIGDVDARVGAYYMVNSGDPYWIGRAAIALLRGDDYTPPVEKKSIAVDPAVLRTYVGSFAYGYSGFLGVQAPMIVTLENGRLFISGMRVEGFGWSKDELHAETPKTFFIRGNERGIKFITDEGGAVTHLTYTRYGREFGRYKKIS
jgi:CubicO group peptidase (beta-lactamase class C family)